MSAAVILLPAKQRHKSGVLLESPKRYSEVSRAAVQTQAEFKMIAQSMFGERYHDQTQHVLQVASISILLVAVLAATIFRYVPINTAAGVSFVILFAYRYLRFIVNTVSWYIAKPYRIPTNPILTPEDVTVIIPSANPTGEEYLATVKSAVASGAAKVLIVTFGTTNFFNAREIIKRAEAPEGRVELIQVPGMIVRNKRKQMIAGVKATKTKITVFCDDHVFWPKGFLQSVLAPFEDPDMGGVGTHKLVQRAPYKSFTQYLSNFFGCIYLDRHNAEILATNRLDGGVFIISSRTAAYRTDILKDPSFQEGFLNEYVNFPIVGRRGPLNADDDNFIMRWLITNDKKIWIQNGPEALMVTTIDNPWSKFWQQLFRWCRTTWRSNPRSFMEGKAMRAHPWSFYATNLSLCLNFALLWDSLLLRTLHRATVD